MYCNLNAAHQSIWVVLANERAQTVTKIDQNSDIAIRFSDPNFQKGSNNLAFLRL